MVAVPPGLLGTAYGIWKENRLDQEVWQVIDEAVSAAGRSDAEYERQRRSRMPRGIPWYEVPAGMSAGEAMVAADPDLRPHRKSVAESFIDGDDMVFASDS